MKRYTVLLAIFLGCSALQNKSDNFNNDDIQSKDSGGFGFFSDSSEKPSGLVQTGYAAWYGKELQGKPTASGELFDMNEYTAAHRDFPMGSLVLVKNTETGRKQLLRINDRGPYVDGRIIDVSYAAARDLGFAEKGTAKVEIELIQSGKNNFLSKAESKENSLEKDIQVNDIHEPFQEEIMLDNGDYVFIDGLRPKGFTVQIGAFESRLNAEKFRSEMKDKYKKPAFIATRSELHHVWLGDFRSKESARQFYSKLRKRGEDVYYRGKTL
ncbi:MAG: septal ring lytic transglycosylase RlpA family protein [Spirochaetia bacterium]|nr:septal ring lytic transglycosylase RlpA family protein [Spirochaetia bacterium]